MSLNTIIALERKHNIRLNTVSPADFCKGIDVGVHAVHQLFASFFQVRANLLFPIQITVNWKCLHQHIDGRGQSGIISAIINGDTIAGEKAISEKLSLDTAKAPLSIDVMINENEICYQVEYRSDMYEESTIAGLVDSLSVVVQEFQDKKQLKEVQGRLCRV